MFDAITHKLGVNVEKAIESKSGIKPVALSWDKPMYVAGYIDLPYWNLDDFDAIAKFMGVKINDEDGF
jgi:hypothetical protein